ncbi:Spartin [Toxocara canis]|uniref:Inheritance of peroxisomes protein 1 n=1 Tax=Toxocara canis TaxID=6265 RepID=A0A0B2VVV8_TOXCA|nr:Spartin [Toxocara canis]
MTSSQHVDDLLAEAFACFEQGLCYDEVDDYENAMEMYERGLNLVKEAEKEKSVKKSELYKNIIEARKRVEKRLPRLKKRKRSKTRQSPSKSEKEKMKDRRTNEDDTVKIELRQQLESVGEGEAELVFCIPDGVQLFIIEGDETTVPTYPCPLQIFQFNAQTQTSADVHAEAFMKGDETTVPTYPCPLQIFQFNAQTQTSADVHAEAFMKVGPWVYPLIPGKTPVLKNDVGAYVVPNPTADHPNMFVGIMLPSDLDEQMKEDFFNYLKQFTEMRVEDITRSLSHEERKRLSDKIAALLIHGSEMVAWGVNFTANKTAEIVAEQAGKHRASVKPNEEPVAVNPAIRTSIHYVHRGSKIVAKCTRYLLDKIGDMGIAVGRQLAASAEKRFGDGKGGGLVSGTINVLGGGIVGASTVWMAMENASKTLCRNIANEAVDTVKVKYGEQASMTAHEALYATGHTTLAAFQLWDLGPRSIAGRAARKAGMQFVTELHKKQSGTNQDTVVESESSGQQR